MLQDRKCRHDIDDRFTTQFFTETKDLVLKLNIHMYDDRYKFHQVKGKATWTKMVPRKLSRPNF